MKLNLHYSRRPIYYAHKSLDTRLRNVESRQINQ